MKAPSALIHLQKEIAKMITLHPKKTISPSQAALYVKPYKNLAPEKRVGFYQNGYWKRLIRIFEETFPLSVRLLGKKKFSAEFIVPYLQKEPSKSWEFPYTESFILWFNKNYKKKDKIKISNFLQIDLLFAASGKEKRKKAFNPPSTATLLNTPCTLQPHVKLLKVASNFPLFLNTLFKKKAEYWEKNPLPRFSTGKVYYLVIYRDREGSVNWQGLTQSQFSLLKKIEKGCTLKEASKGKTTEKKKALFYLWAEKEWFTPCSYTQTK